MAIVSRPCLVRLLQEVVPEAHKPNVSKVFEQARLSRAIHVANFYDDVAELEAALNVKEPWAGQLWRHRDAAGTTEAKAASRQVLWHSHWGAQCPV